MGVHTLLALVEEEFGVTFNQRDAATLKSYSVVRDAVSTAVTK
jgi:acyl carrier protein